MASELCMNCFSVKGQYEVCPFCGYVEGTLPEQPHYLTPGTILGNHFIVGTVIGFGGFGITYKCFDTTLGVTVAVKEFYPMGLVNRSPGESKVGLLSGDKQVQYREQLQRFLMEAQSVAQFGKAKDIVNVYDFFEENNTAYIIMEYIDGVLLKEYLDKQGAMPPEVAMNIIMPIIDAVKKIHSKGIIHRDISPDNIFIASEDSIKIFDFGAAQLNNSKEGMSGEKVIKVGYSAPEQYRDKSRQGFFTDIYSVGAIMYQILTGIKPMESTEREFKDELKSPLELGVNINANVDRAIMEAMAVRPELRFQGIQQFEDALHSKRIAEYPKVKLKKRKRKRNWIISLSATLVLALGVGIGLYSTVLKPENRIFDSTVKEDTIVVWVENDDQKTDIEELVEDGFRKREGTKASANEKIQKMQSEDEKVEVVVEVKPDMEIALQEASSSGKMPNMFLTDHVSNIEDYDLVSLEDNVYASLNQDDYIFMSEYESEFPSMKEMPTGVDTLLLYATGKFHYHKNNKLGASEVKPSENGTVELSTLITNDTAQYTGADKILSKQLATFKGDALVYAAILNNSSWQKVVEKKENPDQEMRTIFEYVNSFHTIAMQNKYSLSRQLKTNIYGSNVVAGVSYRAQMNQAVDAKQTHGANTSENYKSYVVTHNGKMVVTLSERYAITEESSQNQETACMRLLWVMMGGKGQEKKFAPGSTTYPILKSQFIEFSEYNANFDEFAELVNDSYPCILVGNITGKVKVFSDGLNGITEPEQIKEYCEKYVSNK